MGTITIYYKKEFIRSKQFSCKTELNKIISDFKKIYGPIFIKADVIIIYNKNKEK
jgi:hypothetical protein